MTWNNLCTSANLGVQNFEIPRYQIPAAINLHSHSPILARSFLNASAVAFGCRATSHSFSGAAAAQYLRLHLVGGVDRFFFVLSVWPHVGHRSSNKNLQVIRGCVFKKWILYSYTHTTIATIMIQPPSLWLYHPHRCHLCLSSCELDVQRTGDGASLRWKVSDFHGMGTKSRKFQWSL